MAKKVTPGVSVIVDIPLVTTEKYNKLVGADIKSATNKIHSSVLALIVPSFHTKGELVEGLKASVYSEIGVLRYKDDPNTASELSDQSYTKSNDDKTDSETWNNAVWKNQKSAFAIAAGVKYDIKSGDLTITPNAGFRFANEAYVENNINSINPLSVNPVFEKMGAQKTITDKDNAKKKNGQGGYEAGFLNLKAGVDVDGLINNTTFSLAYASANLLNKTDYTSKKVDLKDGKGEIDNPNYNDGWKWYNVKLGTLNVGCKISF